MDIENLAERAALAYFHLQVSGLHHLEDLRCRTHKVIAFGDAFALAIDRASIFMLERLAARLRCFAYAPNAGP